MVASTVPAAKRALTVLLAAHPGLADVQVTRGHPGDVVERELVMVGGTAVAEQNPRSLGGARRDETYSIAVVVQVKESGSSVEDASERAYALLGHVEDAVRAEPTLGGLVMVAEVGGWTDDEGVDSDDSAHLCVITARIDCTART